MNKLIIGILGVMGAIFIMIIILILGVLVTMHICFLIIGTMIILARVTRIGLIRIM